MKTRASFLALVGILVAGTSILASCTPTRTDTASAIRPFSRLGENSTRAIDNKPERPGVPSPRVNDFVLAQSNSKNTRVVIDVADQKGYLLVNDRVALESPVSTARPGKHTPRGTFHVGQRVRTGKISTIYGVEMPYWMRLESIRLRNARRLSSGYPLRLDAFASPTALPR